MIDQIPIFLRKSREINEIFDAEGNQIALLNTDIDDIKAQLSIDTATWGLDVYEKELKIPTDISKPIADRRSVIKSKIRGVGKIDALLIKLTADAYTNGQVNVSFNGHIVIQFTSQTGTPPNLNDFKNALEEIKPAHLAIDYSFRYISYAELSGMTWTQFQNVKYDQLARRA